MDLSHFFNRRFAVGLMVLVFLLSVTTYASDPNVAHWQLDGDATDSSGNGHHGTEYGNPTWIAEGKDGGAIQLDGVDDYVEAVGYQGITGSSSRTCTAWIKTTATERGIIVSWGSPTSGEKWMFRVEPLVGQLSVGVWGGYFEYIVGSTSGLNDGQWHHVTAVLPDMVNPTVADILLYVDGIQETTSTNSTQSVITAGTENVVIGAMFAEGVADPLYFDGQIDDVRIYNRALSAEEIADIVGPVLEVSSNTFGFSGFEADTNPNDQLLTVSNTGVGTVNWSMDLTGKPDWLTVSPTSGSLGYGASENVTLSVDISGLAYGQYNYSFEASDPSAQNSPQIISVNLGVAGIIYVPGDYPTIQAVINASVNGTTIIVSPGTYYENINFNGKDIILTSIDPEVPNIVAATIIDGNANGSVVTFSGSESPACQLRGFTITNGYVESYYGGGGGIYGGGSILSGGQDGTQATIKNCIIIDNTALLSEMYGDHGYGGGLFNCDGLISNCKIIGNETGRTYGYGGGIAECDGTILNCTVADNKSEDGGGLGRCDGTISNCIIWGNSAEISGDQLFETSIPTYSCIQDWTDGGTGNISSDPFFADAANGDFHLKSEYGRWDPNEWVYDTVTSPCIDAGIPYDAIPGDPNDWKNELWPNGGRVNMGAYGGTPAASMSGNPVGNMADLDHDYQVGVIDLDMLCADWMRIEYLLDTDLNLDGQVDIADFAAFAGQWLWQGSALQVSGLNFSFVSYEAGDNPSDQLLTISNISGGTLNWSIVDVNELSFSPPAWLTVTPTSGILAYNENDDVTMSVDITGLSSGQYSYSFEVADPAAQNSPQTVTVGLVILAGPTAHWKLDDDATDSSGNGYHGTVYGNPVWIAEGVYDGAVELDGTGDYIDCDNDSGLDLAQGFSICMWINTSHTTKTQAVISKGANYVIDILSLSSGGYLRFFGYDSSTAKGLYDFTSGYSVADGHWHHIAGTFDGATWRLYDNGAVYATKTQSASLSAVSESLQLGYRQTDYEFTGKLDDVTIYNRVLSAEEIGLLSN